jgi:hypothetical protein
MRKVASIRPFITPTDTYCTYNALLLFWRIGTLSNKVIKTGNLFGPHSPIPKSKVKAIPCP